MSVIPSGDLDILRAEGHTSSVYASFLKPVNLWWAQVNSGALSRGDTVIPFNGGGAGGGGNWAQVSAYQTVWVGTTPGGNEIGKVRLRATSTADAGVTGTITVASNAIPWVDDLYLTFKHNYEFWPMYPYINPSTEVFYKDGDLGYDNNNLTPNPVCIVDFSQRAGFIKNGELIFWVDASDSYAIASGATISSYALTVYPTAGVTVTFNGGTGIGYIKVTSLTQDYYWCRFVITDSNGRNQVSFRCIFAHDPDPTGSTFPHKDFTINQLNGAWDRGGWYAQMLVHDNASLDDIPDQAFVVLWAENAWGLSKDIATIARDDIKVFVNPKIGYSMVPNGANCDVTVNFESGVLVNGAPAANGTSIALDFSVNGGGGVSETDTTTDGILTLSHTFIAEPCSGSILIENIGNTITIVAGTYSAWHSETATGEWPSIMKAFPQMLIVGYVRRENMTFSTAPQGGTGQNTISITTIDDMMRNQYMFSISLAARPSPTKWYEYASWLTIGRAVHHIWRWHSTLFRNTNVRGLVDNTDGRAYAEFESGTLYSMPDTMAKQHGVRAHVMCNKKGEVCLVQDAQLLIDSDRAALDVIANVMPADRSGEIGILRDPEDRIALVYASGLTFAGAFSGGDPDVSPYCAMAPGHVPAGGGEGTVDLERQVLTSQNQLNALAGRVYAKENNLYPEMRIRYHGNYLEYLDFYPAEFWEIDLGTGDTIKELAIPDLNLILRSVAARVDVDQVGGTIRADVTFEPEMDGFDGIATTCPAGPTDLGGEPPVVPPPAELPGAIVTASSVQYLAAGSSAWVQRTTEATKDIIQDPFWRTRQATTDPSDSILLKCGLGHVKRSINGGVAWNDITPSTDPPNDASDSPAPTKTSVTYFRLDGSYITQGEFVVAARWQNATSDWRGWIAFTDDDGSTWTWTSVTSEIDATIDSFGSLNTIGANDHGYLAGRGSLSDTQNAIAVLSESKVVLMSINADAGGIGEGQARAWVANISGDTITEGTKYKIGAQKAYQPEELSVREIDSDTFICAWLDAVTGSTRKCLIQAGDVSGTAISLGNTLDWETQFGTAGDRTKLWYNVDICRMTDTLAVVAHGGGGSGSFNIYVALISISGNTISWLSSEYNPSSTALLGMAVVRLTDTKFVLAYSQESVPAGGVPYTGRAQIGDISGPNITFGSKYKFNFSEAKHLIALSACRLTDSKFVIVWTENSTQWIIYSRVGTVSGNVISWGAVRTVIDTATQHGCPTVDRIDDDHFLVSYLNNDGSPDTEHFNIGTVVGTAIWFYNGPWDNSSSPGSAHSASRVLSTSKAIAWRREDDASPWYEAYAKAYIIYFSDFGGTSGYDHYLTGLNIARGSGDAAYLTSCNDVNLTLQRYTLPSLALYKVSELGITTIAQVVAGTYTAHPFTAFGNENAVYVFGRMNDPDGLGDPSHIIYTSDAGTSYALLEDSWASDICGALFAWGSFIVAIRNSGTRAKVYLWDGVDFNLQSTSLLNAGVKARGMAVDHRDMTLVLCSEANDSVTVVLSIYPYTEWVDITSNHPSSTVYAVEIL